MEPLSLATNIISLVGAAKSAAKKLEKMTKLRHAPQQILRLFNEVSDFRTVLAIVQELDEKLRHQGHHIGLENHLTCLTKKSDDILCKINLVPERGELLFTPESPSGSGRLTSSGWLRNHDLLEQLSKKLRLIRIEITDALTILNVAEFHQLRIGLSDISLTNSELRERITSTQASVNNFQPALDTIHGTLQMMQSDVRQLSQSGLSQTTLIPNPILRIRTSIGRSCSGLCQCLCHRSTNLTTPIWLKGLLGLLFVGYTGGPIPGRNPRACSEKLCSRNRSPLLKVNYYFPLWFLRRMIALRNQWTPTDGHMLTVRTPRIVPSSAAVFNAIVVGNLSQVQILFAESRASPFDVNMSGMSALIYAVFYKKLEICKLLLSEYADPEHEDMSARSAVDWAFSNTLTDSCGKTELAIYRLLEPYGDPLETLRRREFTVIHQIVLGLSQLDLKSQLDVTTTEIDVRDSLGRTPLHWALRTSNKTALEVLLGYGANPNILDSRGLSIFWHELVGRAIDDDTKCLVVLLGSLTAFQPPLRRKILPCRALERPGEQCDSCNIPALKDLINATDQSRFTPLMWAAQNDMLHHVHLLLAHGAVVDLPAAKGSTESGPLLLSVQSNAHRVLKLMLDTTTWPGITDTEQMNVLHLAAIFGDLETINILADSKTSIPGYNDLTVDGKSPLECFDTGRAELLQEGEAERLECREAFLRLLEISKAVAFKNPTAEWARLCNMEEVTTESSGN